MNSLQRVLTTLSHKEPDRIPLFLMLSFYGAKELNMSIEQYYSSSDNIVEGQLKMREKYSNDCLTNFLYASLEIEAWGGEIIFREDGPVNSGKPFIKTFDEIPDIGVPNVFQSKCLNRVLEVTEKLKSKIGNEAPIIGVVFSPFSLPVMQIGFDKYIELIYTQPDLFEKLMKINESFCVNWANAQLEAGATVICYIDPVSSPTIIPKDIYLKTGFEIAKRTISQIKGPTATHLASGRGFNILENLMQTGTAAVGVSCLEELGELKKICHKKLALLGNLNGIEMRRWNAVQTEDKVKEAIAAAGKGGGFILSDNHGDIPWQVPEEVLLAISSSVKKWGTYPLNWLNNDKK